MIRTWIVPLSQIGILFSGLVNLEINVLAENVALKYENKNDASNILINFHLSMIKIVLRCYFRIIQIITELHKCVYLTIKRGSYHLSTTCIESQEQCVTY